MLERESSVLKEKSIFDEKSQKSMEDSYSLEDNILKTNSMPNVLMDLSSDQKATSHKQSKTYQIGKRTDLEYFLEDFEDEDEGHSESYIELKNAIVDCSNILEAYNSGSFTWTSENYNSYNRLCEATTRYVNDHLGAWSTIGKQRLDSAIKIKLALYNISNTVLKAEGVDTEVIVTKSSPDATAAARDNVKRLLKYYRAYCTRIGNDIVGSDEEKIRRRWDVLKSCEQDIHTYLASKGNKKLSTDAAFLKAEYLSLRNMMLLRDLAKKKGEKAAFSNSMLGKIDEHERELDKSKIEDKTDSIVEQKDGLTKRQIAALSKIDTWVVRNFRNGGYMSIFGSACDRTDIIGRLFSMSRRKRMYIYYLVEKNQRITPTPEGLVLSQLEYVPDVSIFKKQMIAHKLKFYSRFSGGYVYWNKLTEAISIAEQAGPVIGDMQKFLLEEEQRENDKKDKNKEKNIKNNIIEQDEDSKSLIDVKEDDSNIIEIKKNDGSKSYIDLDKLENIDDLSEEELEKTEDELSIRLVSNSIQAIKRLQRDSTKGNLTGEESLLVRNFGENAKNLAVKLNRVRKALNDKKATAAKTSNDVKQYVSELPKDVAGIMGILQLGLSDVVYNRLTNGVPMLNIDFDALKDGNYKNIISTGKYYPSKDQIADMKEYYKGGTQLVKLLGNVVGLYFMQKTYRENYDAMNRYDVTSSLGDMASTTVKAVQNFAKVMGVFYECGFVDFMTHDITNATLGVADAVIAGVKTASHIRNGNRRSKASQLAKGNRNKFVKGMVKLDKKLGWKQKTDTTTSILTAGGSGTVSVLVAMSIISAVAAPVALGIVGAAAFGLGIVKRTITSQLSKGMKMALFDNFFKIDDAVNKVKAEWRAKHPNKHMTKEQSDRLVNQVRRRIAADLGFYSPTHASKALAVEYAKYLLDNAKEGKSGKDMCRNFIEGLGLQFKYDDDNDEILVPTESDIVKKLVG